MAICEAQTAVVGSVPTPAAVYDVRAFGALGDGTTLATGALQAAIDQCHAAGGGTVLIAGGNFVTGTLYLKSNVCLHVEGGAAIFGSTRIADYGRDTDRTLYRGESFMDRCLIFARDAWNISLEGSGTIDGQGKFFPDKNDPDKNRPKLLRFINCSRLRLRDLALRSPASWTTEWRYCTDIVVDGITILSRANHNGDGLDFDGCTNVRVANSSFDTSDDCICLQTSLPAQPCHDVVVTNCTFTSRWAGLRIGLLSRGDFENVAVTNCTFRDITDSGIKIQMGEGAVMRNMIFTNLVMKNVLKPVFMTFSQHRAYIDAPPELARMKAMHGFLFNQIVVETETGGKDAGFIITGLPDHPIEDISFSDIRATFAGGGTITDASNVLEELTPETLKGRWPEYSRFNRSVPAHGLYARHVRGLTLHNIQFRTTSPDARPAIALVDVSDPKIPESTETIKSL